MEFAIPVVLAQERLAEHTPKRVVMAKDLWRDILSMPETAPGLFILGLAVIALIWNEWVGIRWEVSSLTMLVAPTLMLPVCALYGYRGRLLIISEIIFYICLMYLFTFSSLQLTYLCYSIGYPLRDPLLAHADAAIGFNWGSWSNFLHAQSLLKRILSLSYNAHHWEPTAVIVLSAILKRRERNAEFLMSLCVAIALTLVITTFVPAIGPGDALGLKPEPAPIIRALQVSPGEHILRYTGIVSFPSFHAAMAVLFAYACRGMWLIFPAAIGLNALMIIGTPYEGDHYVVDVIAGIVVAVVAVVVTRQVLSAQRDKLPFPAVTALRG